MYAPQALAQSEFPVVHRQVDQLLHAQEKNSFLHFPEESQLTASTWKSALSEALGRKEQLGFQLISQHRDQLGALHARFQPLLSRIPIAGDQVVIHQRGKFVFGLHFDAQSPLLDEHQEFTLHAPNRTEAAALGAALYHSPATCYAWDVAPTQYPWPKGELIWLTYGEGLRLCWRFDIHSVEPLKREWVFVDTESNRILARWNRLHRVDVPAQAHTLYDGWQSITTDSIGPGRYRLQSRNRGQGIFTYDLRNSTSTQQVWDIENSSRNWDANSKEEKAGWSAHFAAEQTFDYFSQIWNRNSFDGNGGALKSYVHFGQGIPNAIWNGQAMIFGDGNGQTSFPFVSPDIVAHEFVHGITDHSAGLLYSGESGALNEMFSDVFGVLAESWIRQQPVNWTFGDELNTEGGIRSMSDPQRFNQPDTYRGLFWYTGLADNGGVHSNCGVGNHWFYLLAEGGKGVNDLGEFYQIQKIGIDSAAAITYRTLMVYLTPTANYSDARTWSIRAAEDLYGSCSQAARSVAEAWQAVGVGSGYSGTVQARFLPSETVLCDTPAAVRFLNQSEQATSYAWDFGDGATSSQTHPQHSYRQPGTYTVRLVASGSGLCNTTDTITQTIVVQANTASSPINCQPVSQQVDSVMGIFQVRLHTMAHSSAGSTEGYQDLSCSHRIVLEEGRAYALSVSTGNDTPEAVTVWVDWNADGDFADPREQVFSSFALQAHVDSLVVPSVPATGQALRMRVRSEAQGPIANPCEQPRLGQVEDYGLIIQARTGPPSASFRSTMRVAGVGERIFLSDRSLGAPTSWHWELPGANPSTGTLDSLGTEYALPGHYPVKLKVSNAQGADSVEKTDYFDILPVFQLGSHTFSTDTSGIVYDDGGKNGSYSNGGDWTFTIAPPCARWVELQFTDFDLEQSCDVLTVYDGADTTGTVLLISSGTNLPPTVTARTGKLTIRLQSNTHTNLSGFKAIWRAEAPPSGPPVSMFSFSPSQVPFNSTVNFQDQSTGAPRQWYWDFGDGTLDTGRTVSHAFARSGPVVVQLIADNCFGRDTFTQIIRVQQPPQFKVSPHLLFANISSCDDTVNQYVTVRNQGQGDLVIRGIELPKDPSQLDSVRNRFNRSYPTLTSLIPARYDFLGGAFGTDIVDGGRDMFDNGNVLSTNLGGPLFYFDNFILPNAFLGTRGQYFTRKVSGLFLLAADLDSISSFNVSGGLGADGQGKVDGSSLFLSKKGVGYRVFTKRVFDAGDPSVNHLFILEDRPGISHVFSTNSDEDVHTIRELSEARRMYYLMFGSDNGGYIDDSVMLTLADRFIDIISPGPDYLRFTPDSATIAAGDSLRLHIQTMSAGLSSGRYETDILLQTNDPVIPDTILPCVLVLDGSATIEVSKDSLHFGAVPLRGTASIDLGIANVGCDSLVIYDVTVDSSEFQLGSFTNLLQPGQNDLLEVHFAPSIQRSYQAQCTIRTNVDTLVIPLRGSGAPAPWVHWQPDSLNVAFTACFDSTVLPLVLRNSGSAPLQWSSKKYVDTLSVLALTYGVDLNTEYPNTIQALRDEGVYFTLIESGTDNADSLKKLLTGIDLLLLPEAETGFLSVWQSFQPVISDYVDAGGNVVALASIVGGAAPLFSLELVNGQYRGLATGLLAVALPEEPIAQGLPSRFQAPINCAMLNILDSGYVSVLSAQAGQSPFSVGGYLRRGLGLVTILGMDFEQRSKPIDRLLAQAIRWTGNGGQVSWISVANQTGMVAPGDSATLLVSISSKALNAGAYKGHVFLESNDPVYSNIRIPVRMEANGTAALGLSDSCIQFGMVGRYRQRENHLIISNAGCDTLFLDSLSIGSTAFRVLDILPNMLLPGQHDTLLLQFKPLTVGQFSDSLRLFTSEGDSLVCLQGEGTPVPQTSLSNDSLNLQINSCTDTSRFSFWMYNRGPVATPFHAFAGRGRSAFDVLVVLDQLPWGLDIVQWLNTWVNVQVHTISSTALDNHDLGPYGWIIFVGDQDNSYYDQLVQNNHRLEQFVQSGGLLQLHLATRGTNLQLPGGLSARDGFRETSNDVILPNHPVVAGLGSPLQGNLANHGYFSVVPSQANIITRTSTSRQPTTVTIGLGRGEILATTMTWEYLHNQSSLNSQPLLSQASAWLASENGASPSWLTIAPDSGSLAGNDSVQIILNIHPSGMNSGSYATTLAMRSDDPLNPLQLLQLEMDLQGQPAMVLLDSCLFFPDTRETTESTDTLLVDNPGCDTLWVFSSTGSSAFSVETDTLLVPAGDQGMVIVHFNPSGPSVYSDSLIISSSIGDSIVCLQGRGLGTPRWKWSQDTLHIRMKACEDSLSTFVDLLSIGNADLQYTLPDNPQADSLLILMMTHGTDTTSPAWQRMKQRVQRRIPNHRWISTTETDLVKLQQMLERVALVLIPPIDRGGTAYWNNVGPALQQYVSSGGGLLWCGSDYLQASPLFNSGLVAGNYGGRLQPSSRIRVSDPNMLITQGFPDTIQLQHSAYYLDAQLQSLLGFTQGQINYTSLGYRLLGDGKIVWIGTDMAMADRWLDSAFTNAALWAAGYLPLTWWETTGQGIISPGNQQQQHIIIRPSGLLPGRYEAQLPVTTNHPDSAIARLHLQLELLDDPCAYIAYDATDVCDGKVSFEAVGKQPGEIQEWYFDGRDTLRGLAVDYFFSVPGPHDVTLVTIKDGATDTLRISVEIPIPLIANFVYSGDLLAAEPIQFVADSSTPARYRWDFGDGTIGELSQSQHSYAMAGQYRVSLRLEDSLGCIADTSEVLEIGFGVGIDSPEDAPTVEVFPNPFEDRVWLKWKSFTGKAKVDILDVHGAEIKVGLFSENGSVLDLSELAAGVYVLRIKLGEESFLRRIVKH
jgi:Zn-dependent metalloprotease/PKD repeat protein